LRGLDGEAHGLRKGFEFHRSFITYRGACSDSKTRRSRQAGRSVLRPYGWPPKP
jgi:hypothetical protein